MLNLKLKENIWTPPAINTEKIINEHAGKDSDEYLVIFQVVPYIDALYVDYGFPRANEPKEIQRFTFHEDYHWDYKTERLFVERCLKNPNIAFSYTAMDSIFNSYSSLHPEWHLQRYYTKNMRLLDHIHNCLEENTVKEMLYKAGLDELAVNIDLMDEVNLLATKPSELYDGLSMKVLRALNCPEGAKLVSVTSNREFLKALNMRFPDIFKKKLNDAQCMYLQQMIHGELTAGEAGRLFLAKRTRLQGIWCKSLYDIFLVDINNVERVNTITNGLAKIDPVYKENIEYVTVDGQRINDLNEILLINRKDHDKKIRRSNRKRDESWQERKNGYVVRYPQTANDFCREAIYMHNCLLTYEEAFENNDTTILFMRKPEAVNTPYITIEIYNGSLMQAYHRFNDNCTQEEAKWILDYCRRHEIRTGNFSFGEREDELFG